MSDQDRISPFNTSTISSRQVMRIKKIINTEIMSYRSNTKFSKLTSKELYSRHQGWPKGNFSFKNIILFSSRLVKGKERKASLKRYCFIQHYVISDYLSHNKYMMKRVHNQYLKVGGEDKVKINLLTLDILTSVNIFSIMFTIHFLRHCRGEFVEQSRVSLVGDQFLYSCDLSVWFNGDTPWRN